MEFRWRRFSDVRQKSFTCEILIFENHFNYDPLNARFVLAEN